MLQPEEKLNHAHFHSVQLVISDAFNKITLIITNLDYHTTT